MILTRGPARRVALLLTVALLAGCGAAPVSRPVPPSPAPTSAVTRKGAVNLRQLGFTHGPVDDVWLPSDAMISQRVDEPNVTTVILTDPPAAELVVFLREQLPTGGFTITAERGESLVFEGHGYDGAFTANDGVSGLTLRLRP